MIFRPWATALAVTATAVLSTTACADRQRPTEPHHLAVMASFYPLQFFAQQIAGDKAAVVNLTPPGTEPHDYEPTAQDMVRIEDARLLIVNGGGLEPWHDKMAPHVDAQHTLVVVAGEGLTQQIAEDGELQFDPHTWLSPRLAQSMVAKIAEGFEQVDPDNREAYRSNAAALSSKLRDLDATYREGLARCAKRDITVSHAAFGHLAAAYGLHQVPIAGLSPDAEPSAKQLAAIAAFAKQNHVSVIFFENLVSPKLAETLAAEVGARTMVLNPIEGLTTEELAAGKTYFTEMQQNLAHLQAALECTSTTR